MEDSVACRNVLLSEKILVQLIIMKIEDNGPKDILVIEARPYYRRQH